MIPKLKIENNKLLIDGDFKFELSPAIINEDLTTVYKEITFKWNPDSPSDIDNIEANELIAEKLKQDFLKYLNK